MKRIIIVGFLMSLIFNAYALSSDTIPFFAEVRIDGKAGKAKTYYYIEIKVYLEDNEIKWRFDKIVLQESDVEKSVVVSLRHSRFKDDYDLPLISDVSWVPGKSFECKYHYFHEPINLKAVKKGEGQYDWEVYGSCRYKLRPDDPNDEERLFEIKSVKEIKLKYKKMRKVNLYYK